MIVALLLALEYDLFSFIAVLSDSQRRISVAEAIFLTLLLSLCLFTFALRRLREERHDEARRLAARTQIRELRKLASEDPLTGLANRRVLLSALAEATASATSTGRRHAFFLIDLNDFKRLNDLRGHSVGDRVLQVVAQRFRAATRPSDLLARIGGDEFAVLAYEVDRKEAQALGARFLAGLTDEIRVGQQPHAVGASIGAALIPEDGVTPEEIAHHADLAMYRAKALDHSALVFFSAPDDARKVANL